jgi:hypothetical protein
MIQQSTTLNDSLTAEAPATFNSGLTVLQGGFNLFVCSRSGIVFQYPVTFQQSLTVGSEDSKVDATINGNLTVNGTINGETIGSRSNTITHLTNIIGFRPDQIGCFCEFTGAQADVYSHPIGLDYPTDAICIKKRSTTLNSRILGIIPSENKFANLGDVVCKVVYDNYSLGDWLVPSSE